MINDIKSSLPINDSLKAGEQVAQTNQNEQVRKAQEAQVAQMARKAAEDSIRAQNQNVHEQAHEFINVMDNMVQEGFTLPKSSFNEGAQDSFHGGSSEGGLQRDLQVIKEFIRESNYLISQGMDINQIITKLKVDQGGQFWQNFQQALQKQSLLKGDSSQAKDASIDLAKNLGGELLLGKESGKAQEMKSAASQAMLELLKAEANPQMQKEQFLLALQILSKGNLTESSQRLLSYLRKRGDFSDQELHDYYNKSEARKDIFQGPIHFQKSEFKRTSIWYLLAGLGAFALSFGLGFNLAGSITVGVATVLFIFVFSFILKK